MSLVDLGKKLLEAAKGGRDEEVRVLMTNGAPFTTDWLGSSPLHWAAKHGHASTAEVLLRAGVSRDARTKVDRTPLHMACQEGHVLLAEMLLSHGADINAQDMLKMTPLHWAVERAHVDVVECLLRKGADATKLNKFDKLCLDIAREHNNSVIINLLSNTVHLKNGGTSSLASTSSTVTISTTASPSVANTIKTTTTAITPKAKITSSGKISVDLGLKGNTSSTSVLATLAALAEASAPLKSAGSTSGALSWLQDASISIQPNQTYTLTEAGRIALNLTKPKEKAKPRKPRKPAVTSHATTIAGDVTLEQSHCSKSSGLAFNSLQIREEHWELPCHVGTCLCANS
ncbi:uncharacterized protein [Diadema setosum]|uniref:uncharacterized protein n=1 Tax=Diadema setosum TaxID=31175 RepID=UPI003B3A1041